MGLGHARPSSLGQLADRNNILLKIEGFEFLINRFQGVLQGNSLVSVSGGEPFEKQAVLRVQKSVERKKAVDAKTMSGPVGSWLPRNDRNAPIAPCQHPSSADQINIAFILSVIKDAVARDDQQRPETKTTPTT